MFYNKKGLLAEIKNTEKKISEKIIVLEDLLDSAKQQSLFAEPMTGLDSNLSLNPDLKLEEVTLPLLETSQNTEIRFLSLEDASRLDFVGNEVLLTEAKEDSTSELNDFSDSEPRLSQGVTDMVLEALDNFNKIDVTEPIQIKSFRDVVLMSKKIEHE